MPIYEYTCRLCANTFERLRPMSRIDAEAACPDCGGDSRRRLSVFASFTRSADGDTSAIAGGSGGCCGAGGGACTCSIAG